MKIIKTFIQIIVITAVSQATFIKGSAVVKGVTTGVPFAILFDSTFVMISSIAKKPLPYLEIYAELNESEIKSGRLICEKKEYGNCVYQIMDTIGIVGQNGKTIGKIWNPFTPGDESFGITDLRKRGKGIQVSFDGFIDSSNVYEFEPWIRQIEVINSSEIFKQTYSQIADKMDKVHNRLTDVSANTFKITGVYDEQLPNPNTSMLLGFISDTLRMIWIQSDLVIGKKELFNDKWIYWDERYSEQMNTFKSRICAEFAPGIGMPNPMKESNGDCDKYRKKKIRTLKRKAEPNSTDAQQMFGCCVRKASLGLRQMPQKHAALHQT